MNSLNIRDGKTRIIIVSLLGVALFASMLFISSGTAYAENWTKVFKFKYDKDTYVGALSFNRETFEIIGVNSSNYEITIPSKARGLKVKVVRLSGDSNIDVYRIRLKSKTSNIRSINLKNASELIKFELSKSKVTKLDLSQNKRLKDISLEDNKQLESLDLSKNTNLTTVNITGSKKLKSIDFSKNKKLRDITLNKGTEVTGLSADKYDKIHWVRWFF
jgi:hypothetical protein